MSEIESIELGPDDYKIFSPDSAVGDRETGADIFDEIKKQIAKVEDIYLVLAEATKAPMYRFIFRQYKDDGIVGRGVVAEGVVFSTGTVVVCWRGERTVHVYENVDQMKARNRGVEIVWIDEQGEK